MRKYSFIVLISAVLFLITGCGAQRALDRMKEAKAAYQTCLAAHPKDSGSCKREKEIYESAGQDYDNMSENGQVLR